MTSFGDQIVARQSYLLKFVRRQLRNEVWAEDVVSETILAALAKPQAFGNRSQLKTWLVGILKHEVIDALRHHSREISTSPLSEDEISDPFDYIAFKADGHHQEAPAKWGNPVQDLSSSQFFEVLKACSTQLPAVQGRLFLMREWLDLSIEEISKGLQLTPSNLYVQLHRARLRLRACLELNWFTRTDA